MLTAGAPRHSFSVSCTRERSISRRARNWLSGGSSMAWSFISSIMVPPAPKAMTGPNGSSVTTPMYSSRPRCLRAMACTVTPLICAPGCFSRTASIMSCQMSRTAVAFITFRATPPTSLLWLMSGESIFSATGKPICVAIIMASLALRASSVCVTGM